MSYAPEILIVEDEPAVRSLFYRIFSEDGYAVTAVRSGREAIAQVRLSAPALVILDLSLPDADGFELIRQIVAEVEGVKILAVSGFMAGHVHQLARSAGAHGTLAKPMVPGKLRTAAYEILDSSGRWRGISACAD